MGDGGVEMQAVVLLLVLSVAYLYYRVYRLERLLNGSGRGGFKPTRSADPGNVVPILRSDIPRGPFKPERPRRDPPPES